MRQIRHIDASTTIDQTINWRSTLTAEQIRRELVLDTFPAGYANRIRVTCKVDHNDQLHVSAHCTHLAGRNRERHARSERTTLAKLIGELDQRDEDKLCTWCARGTQLVSILRRLDPTILVRAQYLAARTHVDELARIAGSSNSVGALRNVAGCADKLLAAIEQGERSGLASETPGMYRQLAADTQAARRAALERLGNRAGSEANRFGKIARRHANVGPDAAVDTTPMLIAGARRNLKANVDIRAAVDTFAVGGEGEAVVLRCPAYIASWILQHARSSGNTVGVTIAVAANDDTTTCKLAGHLYSIEPDSRLNTAAAALEAARQIAD